MTAKWQWKFANKIKNCKWYRKVKILDDGQIIKGNGIKMEVKIFDKKYNLFMDEETAKMLFNKIRKGEIIIATYKTLDGLRDVYKVY